MKYFFGCSLSAQRLRLKMAVKRVEIAEAWVRAGYDVPKRFLSLRWQLRRGFKQRRKKVLDAQRLGAIKEVYGQEVDTSGDL